MAGLPHQRLAAERGDAVEQHLARLDVGDDRLARTVLEHGFGKDQHQLVAPDHATLAVDRTDAVAVAVEGDPEIELAVENEPLQVFEVGFDRRVGMMVGEVCRRPR